MKLIQSTRKAPTFSVVIATYARDNFITATLESVANQTFQDFEVIVVSDGPFSSILEEIVREFGSRFSLYSLPHRSRSQSAPNNLGWEKAQGNYIAYLGHDDLWSSDHLSNLVETYRVNPNADFVSAGCIYFGPAGMEKELTWITGLFDSNDSTAPENNFLPPSALSHKRLLTKNVPRWSDPVTTRRPVDTEFVIGAVERNCTFASTAQISVFKFASALRYLSYLCPNDYEQRQIMTLMKDKDSFENYILRLVELAKENDRYMSVSHATPNMFLPGQKMIENEHIRGIHLPEVLELNNSKVLEVGTEYRGFDWHSPEISEGRSFRWTGPNHRPRMLLPFCSKHSVRFVIYVAQFASDDIRDSLQIVLNGKIVEFAMKRIGPNYKISFVSLLNENKISVIEFWMNRTARPTVGNDGKADTRLLGMCLTRIELYPEHSFLQHIFNKFRK